MSLLWRGLLLGLVLLVVPAAAGGAEAYGLERPRSEREWVPMSDDPGFANDNIYYQRCLTRRENGDMACGEVCFWRECVRCENLCDCDPCDECEDEDDDKNEGCSGADCPETGRRGGPGQGPELLVAPLPHLASVTSWYYSPDEGRLPVRVPGRLNLQDGFPDLDLGCPDDAGCPDLDCECGGGDCRAYCGACIAWEWRFLGHSGTGRYPGETSAGFNVHPRQPGGKVTTYSDPTLPRGYWRRDSKELFDMAAQSHLLADYYLGITSRCANSDGVGEPSELEDVPVHPGFQNASAYDWLAEPLPRTPFDLRTPVVSDDSDDWTIQRLRQGRVPTMPEQPDRSLRPSLTEPENALVFRERFVGFIDFRPAPYLVIELPLRRDLFNPFLPGWVRRELSILESARAHLRLEGCDYSRLRQKILRRTAEPSQTHSVMLVPCFARYLNVTRVDASPHFTGELYALVDSPEFGMKKRLPLLRYPDQGSLRRINRGLVYGATAAHVPRPCGKSARCAQGGDCPFYNHRGMLRSSFILQTYPAQAKESDYAVWITALEHCDSNGENCRGYDSLLVHASRSAAGRDYDEFVPLNHSDWRIENEHLLVYHAEREIEGRQEMVEIRRPWVGYRTVPTAEGMMLEYTDTLGHTTLHHPALQGKCRPVCPYLVKTTRKQRTHWGCSYPRKGIVECIEPGYLRSLYREPEDTPAHGFFSDLPYPYCPSLLPSGEVATMEEYRLPQWSGSGIVNIYPPYGYSP